MKKQGKKILIGVLITILLGGLIFVFILNSCNQSNSINKSEIASTSSGENEFNNDENMILDNESKEENIEIIDESNLIEEKENINKQEDSIVINKETTTNNDTFTIDKNTTIQKDSNNKQESNVETLKNTENSNQNTKGEDVQKENEEPSISQAPNKEQGKEPETQQEENNKNDSEDKKENTNQPTNEETTEVKEEAKEEIKQEDVHSYKYNATMTEQIKQDILDNESEYMKQYGYTIVIDESIVDLTNQFTYTSTRVKSKIVKKFGTIRIYARDYYYNGDYMFTECYII